MGEGAGGTGVGSGGGLGASNEGDGRGAVASGEDEGAGKTGEDHGAAADARVAQPVASVGQEPQPTGSDGQEPQVTAAVTSVQPTAPVDPQELPPMGFSADIKEKEDKKVPPKAFGSKKPSASSSSGKAGRKGKGSIFDRKGRGSKFVYVIDFSSSMTGDRLAAAKAELIKSIQGLTSKLKFYVIFYDDREEPMPGENELLRANSRNKNEAIRWIRSIGTRGGTDPTTAMQHALQLQPDVIFLLTDGGFSASVCDAIKAANQEKKVAINTIAFHDPSGEAVLKRIAEENRGDYRFVPPPGGLPSVLPPGGAQIPGAKPQFPRRRR